MTGMPGHVPGIGGHVRPESPVTLLRNTQLDFNNLGGTATYSSTIASGAFLGNYSTGACTNCSAFNPATSTFSGNFLGKGATGVLFSTVLNTGSGTVAGAHVFGR